MILVSKNIKYDVYADIHVGSLRMGRQTTIRS